MAHAFFSHVKEDAEQVAEIARVFEKNGVTTWVDKSNLIPGQNFHEEIRKAIQSGAYYIDVYSKNRDNREKSYANEELLIAIDELRLRGNQARWYIALTLEECNVIDRNIGGNVRLSDFQRAQLHLDWDGELRKLLIAVGVQDPNIPDQETLGRGLPSSMRLKFGSMTIVQTLPPLEEFRGLQLEITNGWCRKADAGHMLGYFETSAPNPNLQRMNEELQLAKFYMVSPDAALSTDAENPNEFVYSRDYSMPKGFNAYNILTGTSFCLPAEIPISTRVTARGHLNNEYYSGSFLSVSRMKVPELPIEIQIEGFFKICWSLP